MTEALATTGQPFLAYLDEWLAALPEKTLEQVAPIPGEAAIFSVDLIQGFCTIGPLASAGMTAAVIGTGLFRDGDPGNMLRRLQQAAVS